jgi:hypothetical protein
MSVRTNTMASFTHTAAHMITFMSARARWRGGR